jgi:hypothetical protein
MDGERKIAYRAGEREFSLGPRATRTPAARSLNAALSDRATHKSGLTNRAYPAGIHGSEATMSAMFRVTIRSEQDEVVEFESEQPVLHVDMPAGRFLITVECAAGQPSAARTPPRESQVH